MGVFLAEKVLHKKSNLQFTASKNRRSSRETVEVEGKFDGKNFGELIKKTF